MTPGLSGLFDALEHVEQRRILAALSRTTEPVEVPIDAPFAGGGPVATEIRLDILHYHVPELEKHGYVTYDEGEHVVTRGPLFAEIRPFLGLSNGHGHTDD